MLIMLTEADQRRMNDDLVAAVAVALDSGRNWADLSNTISNVLSLHGRFDRDPDYVHCQALWHGNGAYEMEDRCPQPSCDAPAKWFLEGDEHEQWREWRSLRTDGTRPPTKEENDAAAKRFMASQGLVLEGDFCNCPDGMAGLPHESRCNTRKPSQGHYYKPGPAGHSSLRCSMCGYQSYDHPVPEGVEPVDSPRY